MKTIKEMIAVMQAFADGKKIEFRASPGDDWEEVNLPSWNWNRLTYRIKPEPKLRPYKNAEEFFEAQQKHGLYLKHIAEKDVNRMPICVDSCGVNVYIETKIRYICFPALLISCIWKDGTKCGVEEES